VTDRDIGWLSTMFAFAVMAFVAHRFWTETIRKKTAEMLSMLPTSESTTAIVDSQPKRSLMPREAMLLRMKERGASGICLHCEKIARFQRPAIIDYQSFGDFLASKLGVDVIRKRRVVTSREKSDGDETFPRLLCEDHFTMETSIQERKYLQIKSAQAEWNADVENDLYEFKVHGVDEEVQRLMADILRKKPPSTIDRNNLRALPSVASTTVSNGIQAVGNGNGQQTLSSNGNGNGNGGTA